MAVNYSSWSVTRLKREQEKIEKALKAKEGKDRQKALTAIRQAAKKSGFELRELLDGLGGGGGGGGDGGKSAPRGKKKASARKKKTTGRKVPPKYRNPDDSSVTWSGRGRQPRWVADWEAKHGDLDGIRI